MNNKIKIITSEHRFSSQEKLKYAGYGEWVEEVDVLEFEYLGYEASVVRVWQEEPFAKTRAYFGGHLCGYVRIPENHVYFGKNGIRLECHGGITYNKMGVEHWVGFDCAHSGDLLPTMEHFSNTHADMIAIRIEFPKLIPKGYENHPLFKSTYKNVNYCVEECIDMIDELINISIGMAIAEGLKKTKERKVE